jgi:hypothetical protein
VRNIDVGAPGDVAWDVISNVERWPEQAGSVSSIVEWTRVRCDRQPRAGCQPRLPSGMWTVTALDRDAASSGPSTSRTATWT